MIRQTQAEPQAEPQAEVLDQAALARLRELDPDGRHGVIQRVFAAFEASLVRMLEQLDALDPPVGQPAADCVRQWAHTLKSSSASVGALVLAQLCSEVENRLRQQGPLTLAADRELLRTQARRTLVAVRAMLRS